MNEHDTPETNDALLDLTDRYLEGTLDDAGAQRLEALVLADEATRLRYVQYVHQHATLRQHRGHQPSDRQSEVLMRLAAPEDFRPARSERRTVPRWAAWAALLILATWSAFSLWAPADAPAIATLQETKNCRWGGGSLPTQVGSPLRPGRLSLLEGLATIRFDSGATVTLEGPAELELQSAMRCALRGGVLLANVPESAQGFKVDTPTAQLIDHGTAFGVNVGGEGETTVQVFEGAVDVKAHRTGPVKRLTTGKNIHVSADRIAAETAETAEPQRDEAIARPAAMGRHLTITTAAGAGQETYVYSMDDPQPTPGVLQLKNALKEWNRKIYLSFDLSALKGKAIRDAAFTVNLAPTGRGYVSHVPDATVGVYGLIDESLDDWSATELRWDNAPANAPGGAGLDTQKVALLGRFSVEQGVLSGMRTVEGPALNEFLRRDTNGRVTIILVRDTRERRTAGYVHGIAAQSHPSLAPPTLRVAVD